MAQKGKIFELTKELHKNRVSNSRRKANFFQNEKSSSLFKLQTLFSHFLLFPSNSPFRLVIF